MLEFKLGCYTSTIVKIDTHPTNKLYSTCNLLSRQRLRRLFLSASSFKLIKDVSHSSDLVCWYVFVYRVNLSFSFRAHRYCFIQIYLKFIKFI